MGLLDNKVIIITGAGSGIGRSAAIVFAREGARVALADINESAAQQTATMLGGDADVITLRCNVASEDDVANMVAATTARWGRLDGAFNNAGIGSVETPLTENTLAEWRRILDVDLLGTMLCLKYEIPAMLASGGGAIVNTASNAGKAAVPMLASYAAAKAGAINLSLTAAVEFGARAIRVNAICPGLIMTEAMRAVLGDGAKMADALQIPMGRPGNPDEVGELAAWLLSSRASYVTGQSISIDGGQSACQ